MAAGVGVEKVLAVAAVVFLLISTSGGANAARSDGGAAAASASAYCVNLRSAADCGRSAKRCRWCESDVLDDRCFGAAEAWRLPQQVFSCA